MSVELRMLTFSVVLGLVQIIAAWGGLDAALIDVTMPEGDRLEIVEEIHDGGVGRRRGAGEGRWPSTGRPVRPAPEAWDAYNRRSYPARPPADLAEHQQRIRQSMRHGDHWRSFVKTNRTSHAPVEARLDEVQDPALVVMGEKDQHWPDSVAEAHFIAEALNAEVLLVPDAGHYPVAEYPELVNPAVIEFAERVHARS